MIKKLRSQQIVMELPKEDSDVFIRATLQQVIKDENYKTIQLIDRVDAVHRELSQVLGRMITFPDPVSGSMITLPIATIGAAITATVVTFILEDHPEYHLNSLGDIIKED
jgi:hypothetical protein